MCQQVRPLIKILLKGIKNITSLGTSCGSDKQVFVSKRNGGKARTSTIVIGTSEKCDVIVAGRNKALLFVDRLKVIQSRNQLRTLQIFFEHQSKDGEAGNKGTNASVRLRADFEKKDKLINFAIWPENTLEKRFLFRRTLNKPQT